MSNITLPPFFYAKHWFLWSGVSFNPPPPSPSLFPCTIPLLLTPPSSRFQNLDGTSPTSMGQLKNNHKISHCKKSYRLGCWPKKPQKNRWYSWHRPQQRAPLFKSIRHFRNPPLFERSNLRSLIILERTNECSHHTVLHKRHSYIDTRSGHQRSSQRAYILATIWTNS